MNSRSKMPMLVSRPALPCQSRESHTCRLTPYSQSFIDANFFAEPLSRIFDTSGARDMPESSGESSDSSAVSKKPRLEDAPLQRALAQGQLRASYICEQLFDSIHVPAGCGKWLSHCQTGASALPDHDRMFCLNPSTRRYDTL